MLRLLFPTQYKTGFHLQRALLPGVRSCVAKALSCTPTTTSPAASCPRTVFQAGVNVVNSAVADEGRLACMRLQSRKSIVFRTYKVRGQLSFVGRFCILVKGIMYMYVYIYLNIQIKEALKNGR